MGARAKDGIDAVIILMELTDSLVEQGLPDFFNNLAE
jgi:hypothetical protein